MPDTPGKCRDQEDSDYLADDAKRGVGSKERVRQWMHRLHVQACECTKTHSSAEETLGMKKPVCKMHSAPRLAPAIQKKAVMTAVKRHPSAGPHPSCDMAPYSISPKDFLLFQAMIYRESGIWLSEAKTALLTGRLSKRLRALGLRNFTKYYRLVDTDEEERRTMLDAITTNETHFFREPGHFDFLAQHVFPSWRQEGAEGQRPTRLRVWSAGCSS